MTGNDDSESNREDGALGGGISGSDGTPADPESSTSRGNPPKKQRSFLRELPILVVVALVLSFLLQTFLARVYLIPSESMEPTLHGCTGCTGDRIVVDKVSYRFGDPEPGDVVVFKSPPSWSEGYQSKRSSNVVIRGAENLGSLVGVIPPDENDLVKRVIAVGGQKVQCLPEDPAMMVDGKPLSEPYIDRSMPGNDSACQGRFFGPVTVPEGNVWVMGDNRANSKDSRFHLEDDLQGTIPVSDIIGKVRFIVLPPSRWGAVHAVDPQQ
ncbi:signal peptidase I [Rhodococcus sp. LBL1]|nr:signal peptidase I [Rhodococcus sp. LBL1]MDH6686366.1 signal peptidase I [Rhodococcus sp. LBL2]